MRVRSVLAVAAAFLVMAGPASATPPPNDYIPTFTRADLFLHSAGSAIGNLDARDGKYLGWNATSPTASQASLYHGNNYEVFVGTDHDPESFLTMQGTAVGDLDDIAFDLYFVGWAQSTIKCSLALSFQLLIDGQEILYQDYLGSDGIKYKAVDSTTNVARFALTHLWEASRIADLAWGPDVQHSIYLNIQNFYACNEVTWLYDSTDRPSGLIVNLPTPVEKGYFEINVLEPPPPPAP